MIKCANTHKWQRNKAIFLSCFILFSFIRSSHYICEYLHIYFIWFFFGWKASLTNTEKKIIMKRKKDLFSTIHNKFCVYIFSFFFGVFLFAEIIIMRLTRRMLRFDGSMCKWFGQWNKKYCNCLLSFLISVSFFMAILYIWQFFGQSTKLEYHREETQDSE